MTSRQRVGLLIVAICLLLGAMVDSSSGMIAEDSPDWDCRTMGNHLCGDPNPYWPNQPFTYYYPGGVIY